MKTVTFGTIVGKGETLTAAIQDAKHQFAEMVAKLTPKSYWCSNCIANTESAEDLHGIAHLGCTGGDGYWVREVTDEEWYLGEEALEQERRDRAADLARHID